MKKIFFAFVLVSLMCSSVLGGFEVVAKNSPKPLLTVDDIVTSICNDSLEITHKSITINNQKVKLYPEFKDKEKVLKKFTKEYQDLLLLIKEEFELDNLSVDNWKDYQLAVINTQGYKESIELVRMKQFFDIFENTKQNDKIEELAIQLNASNKGNSLLFDNSLLKKIDLLTPYNSTKLSPVPNSITMSSVGINIDDAVQYATDYATSPNTAEYDKFSSDCTNFVSQILEAGGVQQEVYDDETKGWWHKVSTNWLGWTVHDHSISFIRADTFAKYMGVTYTTKNHENFSQNLSKGDFIAYDSGSDGDWDHMAFVTAIGATYTDYRDYKVAQHTTNYHAWVSSSENGWEILESKGYTYGIVR